MKKKQSFIMAGAIAVALCAGFVTKAKIESRRLTTAYYREAGGNCVSLTSVVTTAFTATPTSLTPTTAKVIDENGIPQQLFLNTNCTGAVYFNK